MQTIREYLTETLRDLATSEAEAALAIRQMETVLNQMPWVGDFPAELVKDQVEENCSPLLTLAKQRRDVVDGERRN